MDRGHSASETLEALTRAGGKSYAFRTDHDATKPIEYWFQESDEGTVLFVVFYTMACRWSACTGCNLPSLSADFGVRYGSIMRQLDWVLDQPEVQARMDGVRKLIVSNNGSVLDEVTFPSTALMYLIARINTELPSLRVISFETRPEYVDIEELEFLARAMAERDQPADIELAVGFEAFDDDVRNGAFRKGLSLASFEGLVDRMRRPHLRLKCYFMQKPIVGMTDEAAIEDIERGIDYLDAVARRSGVPINLHLNPTYAARGTPLAEAFVRGDYEPPRLRDVARAALHARGKQLSVYVGLYDEGLAVEGGSFLRADDTEIVRALADFNRSQDYDDLARTVSTLRVSA